MDFEKGQAQTPMPRRLPPHFIDLVQDALLKSFWTKKALRRFLRRSHIAEGFVAQLSDGDTKREWLDELFPKLEATDRGQALIQQMAQALGDQLTFPDLENWEDSSDKIRGAKAAVAALRQYLEQKVEEKINEKKSAENREAAGEQRLRAARSQSDLAKLKDRLDELCGQLGTQQGGYAFQDWFYDLMDYCEIDNRRPYVSARRQIDGSITVDGTTYLVELKFTSNQADAPDIDSLAKKVNDKADNTMGIAVSMAGFTSVAVETASFARSPLLLLDHSHLYMVLGRIVLFPDVVRRVRRHSSQEGRAYLAVTDFGGR
jgi:restriction endonuclease